MQEIDGQLESERKYVERLAVEDFGTTHVGKVFHDDDDDEDDDDGQAMMMMVTTTNDEDDDDMYV